MQQRNVFGLALIFLGLVIFFSKHLLGIGGFAVSGQIPLSKDMLFNVVGLCLVIYGLILVSSGIDNVVERVEEEQEKIEERIRKKSHPLRSSDSLKKHNREARRIIQDIYTKEYGVKPTHKQLKEYIRILHERGELHETIKEYKGD